MSTLDLLNYICTPIMTLGAILFILDSIGVSIPKIMPWKTSMPNKWKLIIGIVVLLISWGISVIGLYNSLRPRVGMDLKATAEAWATYKYEYVLGRHFVNEAVDVDGKYFSNCTFENVTFIYQGKGPVQIFNSQYISTPNTERKFHTDNALVQQTMRLLKGIGMMSAGYRDELVPPEFPKN